MKTRIFYPKIYGDSYFVELSVNEKFLFIYYITNDHINTLALYECPDRVVQFETGIEQDLIQKTKLKFEQDKKFFFKDDWVFIKNAHRYQKYKGPQNEKAKANIINSLSDEQKDWFMDIVKKFSAYSLSELVFNTTIDTLPILPINKKPELRNQNQEPINQKEKIENNNESK